MWTRKLIYGGMNIMRNKSLKLVAVLLVLSLLLVACGKKVEPAATTNQMQYIVAEDLKESIEAESGDYVILDVRKIEDFNKGHIVGSFDADQDAANKGGDDAKGIENLKVALKSATGDEKGAEGTKYALVCYSGKSYAQKATDLMIQMGVPADSIFTLEGGMTAWEEAGDDYKNLLGN
jgi:rhodanese-related sulfurtransferase